MAVPTLQQVFDAARGYLNDFDIAGGSIATNANLQIHFNEAYRRMFNCLAGESKRIQRVVEVVLPALTTTLIPWSAPYYMTDFSEPELIEERPEQSGSVNIATTDTSTPIIVTTTAPNTYTTGVEVSLSNIQASIAPWGRWFITVIDSTHFSLNGSASDGVAGVGGIAVPVSTTQYTPVSPIDLADQGLDGQPQQYLGVYLWASDRLQFRGAVGNQQLRITYWASGAPPTDASRSLGIDNCQDFLACATAANFARSVGWFALADQLKFTAFGAEQEANGIGGLLGDFLKVQILTLQRGPQRRLLPFRTKISRFGTWTWQ